MPKYGFLVVEGPHDIEFVYRLLRPFGLIRVRLETNLDPFLEPLIPRKYPPDGDLQKRMNTPLFLQSQSHAIAVHGAVGDSRLVETVEENASILDMARVTGVGIFLDSDDALPAATRYTSVRNALAAKNFAMPPNAGQILGGPPRMGAFVLPDNASQGTLEDLLIECAQQVYPGLLASATNHVDSSVKDVTLDASDKVDIAKPAGRTKAIVGSISSILRPGKAVQVSIQDNRWLRGNALTIARIKAVQDFLVGILELP